MDVGLKPGKLEFQTILKPQFDKQLQHCPKRVHILRVSSQIITMDATQASSRSCFNKLGATQELRRIINEKHIKTGPIMNSNEKPEVLGM